MIDPSELSEIDRTSLAAIQEESASMTETIEAFRRVVRPLAPAIAPVPVAALVADVLRDLQAERTRPVPVLTADVAPGLEVSGDRVLLEDALGQVIRNALEACGEAGSEAPVTLVARPVPDRGIAVITVRDNGGGVALEDRERLFTPFFSTKADHVGLGLTQVRHIVIAHGGRIEVEHPHQGGLVVSLVLPLAESAA
jgi:signal transduction histidine kinase